MVTVKDVERIQFGEDEIAELAESEPIEIFSLRSTPFFRMTESERDLFRSKWAAYETL